jgi:hypothetical protein
MAQFGRPSTDTTRTNWEEDDGTTTDIFDQIDEAVADDADYLRTGLAPTGTAVYVTKLTTLEDPVSSSNHVVRYRYGKDASGGAAINMVVQLRQGYVSEGTPGTLIASQTHNDVGVAPQAGSFTLSGGEADAITDYTDLYLRITAVQV